MGRRIAGQPDARTHLLPQAFKKASELFFAWRLVPAEEACP
jgi:hypothetical protein